MQIKDRLKEMIEEEGNVGEFCLFYVKKEKIREVIKILKDEFNMNQFVDLFGVDKKDYFEVVYQLLSADNKKRIFLKIKVKDGQEVDSISDIFKVSKYYELECSDMFGIKFKNNPLDMKKRYLLFEGFEGFPLRK